jgi:hypothetical protein
LWVIKQVQVLASAGAIQAWQRAVWSKFHRGPQLPAQLEVEHTCVYARVFARSR